VSISRTEAVAANLVTEFQTMTVANGYRNELALAVVRGIKPVERVTRDIEVGIEIADELIQPDEIGQTFEADAEVYVEATVKHGLDEAEGRAKAESVLHDIKRCAALTMKKYLLATAAWNIRVDQKIVVYHDVLGASGKTYSRTGVKFRVHMRTMTEDMV
jgi:hypothetical protein